MSSNLKSSTLVRIHDTAQLGHSVSLGENIRIEAGVRIGDGCIIDDNVYIGKNTIIGENCHIFPGAVIGTAPQDIRYNDEPSMVVVGNQVQIREYVTIHRGTGEYSQTTIDEGCLLMAYSHVGHNCQLGKEVTLANGVQLGGYAQIGDYANLGGSVVVHQFCRVGRYAMMSGFMATRQDVPPFSTTDGRLATVRGLNKIGLKRRGIAQESIHNLKDAFRLLWFKGLPQKEALIEVKEKYDADALVQELITFIESSKRGIRRPSTLKSQFDDNES